MFALFAICLFLTHVFLLWFARGHYTVGWEQIGLAHGMYQLEQKGFLQASIEVLLSSFDYVYWAPTNSLLFCIIPGLLGNTFPWLLWGQAWAFVFVMIFWFLLCRQLELSFSAMLFFTCLSPTLLSFSIVGFPYLSSTVPYCLGLMLLHKRLPILAEALAWIGITLVASQCYELGRSFFVLAFLGALLPIENHRRVGRLVLGVGIGVYELLSKKLIVGLLVQTPLEKITQLPASIWQFFQLYFWDLYLDLPTLLLLAVPAVLLLQKDRTFWIGLLAIQLGLLFWSGTVDEEFMRPRRLVLLNFVCVLIVTQAWTQVDWLKWKKPSKSLACLAISFGQVATLASTLWFCYMPHPYRSLPFTHSPADFRISRPAIDDVEKIVKLVRDQDTRTYLLYGYSNYPENTTDPLALPERLIARLGVRALKEKLILVDDQECRYNCFPFMREAAFESQELAPGAVIIFPKNDDSSSKNGLSSYPLNLSVFSAKISG